MDPTRFKTSMRKAVEKRAQKMQSVAHCKFNVLLLLLFTILSAFRRRFKALWIRECSPKVGDVTDSQSLQDKNIVIITNFTNRVRVRLQ